MQHLGSLVDPTQSFQELELASKIRGQLTFHLQADMQTEAYLWNQPTCSLPPSLLQENRGSQSLCNDQHPVIMHALTCKLLCTLGRAPKVEQPTQCTSEAQACPC
eukprot:597708-Pelagomonas_calceolata.AAC.1